MAEPPLCTFAELINLTIDDVADMNEMLDVKRAGIQSTESKNKRRTTRQAMKDFE